MSEHCNTLWSFSREGGETGGANPDLFKGERNRVFLLDSSRIALLSQHKGVFSLTNLS